MGTPLPASCERPGMDEAEKYQQRLQAIAERRRRQEEEERLTRETEEEWLKTAQEKRKHLREQWLSEVSPVLDDPTTGERTESQKTPKDEEAAEARREEQASREENKESGNCAAAVRTHSQAGTDEDEQQVNKDAEDHISIQMAQRMFHESGQEGRSVLGMLAVQVERDPKTGATVVRSVAPVSSSAGVPMATTVFDDGRKSIHAVGGSASQPSTEELGQILSFVDGVGMKVLLDEVVFTPNQEETEMKRVDASRAPKGQVVSFSTRRVVSKGDDPQLDVSRSDDLEAELGIEECSAMGQEEDDKEDGSIMVVRDIAGEVGNVEDLRLEEGPVTLVFLGYRDGDQGGGQEEDHEGMLTAQRVIITEEGEEHVLGPETSASPQEEKESQVFHDIPLDGNGAGVEVQGENGDDGWQNSSSPSKATSKPKTCRCCSVM
ncbi:paralemmin-2-like [Anarrhichthys ocellatus]|uniref:paralemmin-2-like n=1 Tax=Anarrhichthys ocellatus TaxID=433405 RepID=UPI0012ED9055|nr:paralemmin-2-like [Anarrhichthys ocellatus]